MRVQRLAEGDARSIRVLLEESKLPTGDLEGNSIYFLGCRDGQGLAGLVGLELYGSVGLLRSLAVRAGLRGQGMGKRLVGAAEEVAVGQGVRDLYLLTTTAADFFAAGGYSRSDRAEAPEAIKGTKEFAALCPASAAFMVKHIAARPE